MSEPASKYTLTLRELRFSCILLDKIEVLGDSIHRDERLVGRDATGKIVVQVKGKVTPRLVDKFRNTYQTAVAAGIIKQSIPTEQEPAK